MSSNNISKTRKKRKKNPAHTTVTRAFSFPIDVSEKDADKLNTHIDACWRLRNRLVFDRISNRIANRHLRKQGEETRYLTRAEQYNSIKSYLQGDPGMAKVHSQVLQNVAVRVDEGHKRFFEALKAGNSNVHPPKFIDRKKYKSITYPQYGSAARVKSGVLSLSKLGDFRIRAYRKIRGRAKTVTIKFKQGRWWAIITAEMQEKDAVPAIQNDDSRIDGAIDPGIENLLTDSDGNTYDPPKAFALKQAILRRAQKKMSRQFEARAREHEAAVAEQKKQGTRNTMRLKDVPYSNRLRKQIRAVAILHAKIERIRDHFHKKNAATIEARFRNVAVEEHGVRFMLENRKMARAASDRAIHKQKLLLRSKLGPRYREAPACREGLGGNSQRCVCGARVEKTLSDRIHLCTNCGLAAGRDHMAANIVLMDMFGYASLSLRAPAAGRAVDMRGEDKAMCGESRLRELPRAASEFSVKRRPPVRVNNTTDAEAAVAGKTTDHRRAIHRRALTGEPKGFPSAIVRRHSLKDEKAQNLDV